MSNQPQDTPIETDESEAADPPAEPRDAEPDQDERAQDESSGTSTSDLPQGAKDGELPPAP